MDCFSDCPFGLQLEWIQDRYKEGQKVHVMYADGVFYVSLLKQGVPVHKSYTGHTLSSAVDAAMKG